jgi:hypothetical protein
MNTNRRRSLQQAAEVHRANLRQRLEQRLETAKAAGNTALLQILEREREQLA